MHLEIGEVVDRYVVEEPLGEGGMALVYRVRHVALGTIHALKLLKVHRDGLRQRLLREGQLQASLRHPNIVAVTDVLAVRGATGLLLEYVHGPSLRELIDAGPLPLDEALAIFRGVCAAVAHAHHRGLIHRDLKPDNVLMALDDDRLVPKVTDFGLVKAIDDSSSGGGSHRTRTGATLGTPAFMSPEQINDSSRVDRRADMWSLGCVLYLLACGTVPFDADELIPLFQQIGTGRYTPPQQRVPDLPPRVVAAIEGLLQPDPRRRIADCPSLLAFLDGEIDAPRVHDVDFGNLPPTERLQTSAAPSFVPAGGEASRRTRELLAQRAVPVQRLPTDALSSLNTGPQDPTVALQAASSTTWHGPSVMDEPAPKPRRWPLAAGAALTVVLGAAVAVGVWGPASRVAQDPPPASEPEAPVAEAAPVVPAAPEAPPDVPADAAPAEPEAEPEPAPKSSVPVRAAITSAPKSRPEPVEPTAAPEPAPAAPAGTVTFEGADALVLVGEDDREVRGRDVPAGSYRVMAKFPDTTEPVSAGYLTVKDGGTHHLTCVAQMRKCAAR